MADTHINSQVPDISSLIQSTDLNDQPISCQVVPLWESPSLLIAGMVPMVGHTLMNNRRHAVTVDAAGKTSLWDIIRCQHLQDLDVPYDDAIVTCNTDEWVGSWCTLDTKFGVLIY